MITTCTKCGKLYEAGSEDQANEPDRLCRECAMAAGYFPPPEIQLTTENDEENGGTNE